LSELELNAASAGLACNTTREPGELDRFTDCAATGKGTANEASIASEAKTYRVFTGNLQVIEGIARQCTYQLAPCMPGSNAEHRQIARYIFEARIVSFKK
jgi:hypothetical protein